MVRNVQHFFGVMGVPFLPSYVSIRIAVGVIITVMSAKKIVKLTEVQLRELK